MKRIIGLVLTALLLASLVLGCFTGCSEGGDDSLSEIIKTKTIRIGLVTDCRPVAFVEDGELTGLAADLGRELALRLGAEPELKAYSVGQVRDALAQGEIDLCINYTVPDRETELLIEKTDSRIENVTVVVVRSGSSAKRLIDLKGKRVAAQAGSDDTAALSNAREFSAALKEVVVTQSAEESLARLGSGGVHAAVLDKNEFLYLTLKAPSQYRYLAQTLASENFVTAFPNEAAALQKRVEQLLAQIETDGTLERLKTGWIVPVEAEVSPADISPSDVSESDLSMSDISGSDLSGSDISGSDIGE